MALSWIDFINGEALASVRSKINSFNNSVVAEVTSNSSSIVTNTGDIATNTGDIATNTANITTNTGDITQLKAPTATVFTDVTGSEPAFSAGQLYYANGSLNFQNGYSDVTLQVGKEQHIEVYNNSGADIINGQACRHNGTAAGLPAITLAIADSFVNARVLGIATHNIPQNTVGVITTFGSVGGIDTTGLTPGVPIYLSDTVPGGLTVNTSEVLTQLGGSLVEDALIGELFIAIDNNMELPTVSGTLQGINIPSRTITTSPVRFDDYITQNAHYTIIDALNGTITVNVSGFYEVETLASLSGATSINSPQDVLVQVFVNGIGAGSPFPLIIGRNGTRATGTPFEYINLTAGDILDFRYWSNTTNGQTLSFDLLSFSVTSVNLLV